MLATFDYVGRNRPGSIELVANGTKEVLSYDGSRRLVGTRHESSSTAVPFFDRLYVRDRVGNKTVEDDLLANVSHECHYDSTYRMVDSERRISGAITQVVDYSLDGAGNRTQVTGGPDAGVYALSGLDASVHQYSATPEGARSYDENGNLLSRVGGSFAYDWRNRLVTHMDSAGVQADYRYDVFGRRIAKVVDDGEGAVEETRYIYQGWQVVEERNGSDQLLASYVYGQGLDAVLTMRRGGADVFYHADDLGNVMGLSDSSGNLLESYAYGNFGELLDPSSFLPFGESASGNPYFFQGRRLDAESWLYHFRHRQLDPGSGRFLTRDPIGMWGDVANFGNGYTFAGNNPWTFTDPMGLEREEGRPYGIDARDVILGGGEVVGSCIPVVGELMDIEVMFGSGYAWWERGLAGLSLAGNVVTGGLAPNAGGIIRGSKRVARALDKIGDVEDGVDAAGDAARAAGAAKGGGKPFSKEKGALVDMAKGDKRTGMTRGDMDAYKDLNKGLPDPFPANKVRGPEVHPPRTPNSPPGPGQKPHGHVGPVNHIPINGG